MRPAGLEPTTFRLRALRSADSARRARKSTRKRHLPVANLSFGACAGGANTTSNNQVACVVRRRAHDSSRAARASPGKVRAGTAPREPTATDALTGSLVGITVSFPYRS